MEFNEKKGKRPRIGQQRTDTFNNPENTNDTAGQGGGETTRFNSERSYQPRQGGYNNRYNNGYNQGERRDYRPYRQYNRPESDQTAEGQEGENTDTQRHPYNGGYRQNNHGYNRYNNNNNNSGYGNHQGGYNNRDRQGGYGNRPNNNNRYNNHDRQGGYNNDRQGGYNNRDRQGGYGQNRNNQNGYGNRDRQGGYNNRQGGYNNRNNQGGYGQNRNNQRPQRNEFGMPKGGKSFVPRPKRIEYEQVIPDPDEKIRLNKFMANAGICSRREADEFIRQGLVKVNGETVTELGTKISHSDTVEYDEKVVALEKKCYILLNKPKDCVTTADDPNGRLTVMDLVKNACDERIYPVGRLDRNTTGVLLLTNDGDLASKLTHPKYVKKKIYHVWTDKDISEDDMQAIADGIELEDGPIHADAISYATENDRNQAGIEIHSGRNRIVRRIFESLGYHVTKLDRVYFAGLTKKNLPRGRWRYLTQEEVNFLKMGSFE